MGLLHNLFEQNGSSQFRRLPNWWSGYRGLSPVCSTTSVCCDQRFLTLRLLHKDTHGVVLYLVAVIRDLRPAIVLFNLKKLSNGKDNQKKLESTPVKTLWSKQLKRIKLLKFNLWKPSSFLSNKNLSKFDNQSCPKSECMTSIKCRIDWQFLRLPMLDNWEKILVEDHDIVFASILA